MNLRKALEVLEINKFLEEKKKYGSELIKAGLFEGCNQVNEAIKEVMRFMNEVE